MFADLATGSLIGLWFHAFVVLCSLVIHFHQFHDKLILADRAPAWPGVGSSRFFLFDWSLLCGGFFSLSGVLCSSLLMSGGGGGTKEYLALGFMLQFLIAFSAFFLGGSG